MQETPSYAPVEVASLTREEANKDLPVDRVNQFLAKRTLGITDEQIEKKDKKMRKKLNEMVKMHDPKIIRLLYYIASGRIVHFYTINLRGELDSAAERNSELISINTNPWDKNVLDGARGSLYGRFFEDD